MLDFAWSEFFLLAIIALIFLGPKELVILLRSMGRWVAQLRALQRTFIDQVNAASVDLENEKNDTKNF